MGTSRCPSVVFVLAVLHLGVRAPAAGQDGSAPVPDPPRPAAPVIFRLEGGLGFGSTGSGEGALGGLGSVTLTPSPGHRILLRVSVLEEFTLSKTPAESMWDLAALYGRELPNPQGYTSFAAGPAITGGTRRGERIPPPASCRDDFWSTLACGLAGERYEKERFETLGLAFQASVGWTPNENVGLAMTLFGNLNSSGTAVGFSLGLILGQIR